VLTVIDMGGAVKQEWDYDTLTKIAADTIAAIAEDAQGKYGETGLLYECEVGGVFRLWKSIVGQAALDEDVARLQALCNTLAPQPPTIPTLQ
jgi:hypothetical protein